jgi:hypothetical protein
VDDLLEMLHEVEDEIADLQSAIGDLEVEGKARRRRRRRRRRLLGFRPPGSVASAARRGLWLKMAHGVRGTNASVLRARKLARRRAISLRSVRSMHRFFKRAKSPANEEPAGRTAEGKAPVRRIMWMLNGGASGRAWVRRIVQRVRENPFLFRKGEESDITELGCAAVILSVELDTIEEALTNVEKAHHDKRKKKKKEDNCKH